MGIWYDKKAYELLKKCSDAKDLAEWNEYRKATNYAPINLRFADLSNFYLQKAELQNVDLRGAVSIRKADFSLANVENTKFLLFNYHRAIFLFFITFGFLIIWLSYFFYQINLSLATNLFVLLISILIVIGFVIGVFLVISKMTGAKIFIMKIIVAMSTAISGFVIGAAVADMSLIFNILMLIKEQLHKNPVSLIVVVFVGITIASSIRMTMFAIGHEGNTNKSTHHSIRKAENFRKAIGIDEKYLNDRTKSVVEELQQEATELSQAIATTQDDDRKQVLLVQQKKLEEKIHFYSEQEKSARPQKTQIENVIAELQAPYRYIHQIITKIEWHNRIYYLIIFGLTALFLYSIAHGYIDQRVLSFTSLFTKDIQPTFGTIFGVILFYGSPVLLGISLIIYFIAQINKNIDKVTELQEQERNIKQIASTIKAKAQIGMSDDEFVKETKNLIQKYQEGMMGSMFSNEKTLSKEEKEFSPTYREKLIASGVSKLIMQALKK